MPEAFGGARCSASLVPVSQPGCQSAKKKGPNGAGGGLAVPFFGVLTKKLFEKVGRLLGCWFWRRSFQLSILKRPGDEKKAPDKTRMA